MVGALNWLVTQVIAAVAFVAAITGSVPEPSTSPIFALGGTAIHGYDPVAYFTDGRPVRGSRQFAYEWNGTTWHFASAEHLARFAADPDVGRKLRLHRWHGPKLLVSPRRQAVSQQFPVGACDLEADPRRQHCVG